MISTLIEMVAKYDSVRCSDEYCEVSVPLGHERRCIASNAPFCEFHFVEVHRPDCGYCTLHLEQQRESILKGVPTLDLERWADDQQSGPMGATQNGDSPVVPLLTSIPCAAPDDPEGKIGDLL